MSEANGTARRITRGASAALLALVMLLTSYPGRAQQQPDFDQMSSMLTLMQNFYGLMASVHDMAADPQKAALLQMHEIEEIYKKRGEIDKVIPVYREVLASTKDPTIRAMAYMKLADVLKKTGRGNQSIEVLREALKESLARAREQGRD